MGKRFAVLSSGYPSSSKPNYLGYVHSRVRAYVELGNVVEVYVVGEPHNYIFEGISVTSDSKENIKKKIDQGSFDAILVHFLTQDKIDILGDKKCLIWVHGFEALSWKRRLFNINPRLPLYIIDNTKQLSAFKKYAKTHPDSKFIFVSKWMYEITCADIGYRINNYEIIHNYIDANIFGFELKEDVQRKKILLIRSFANKKYANDISVKIIKELSKKPYFKELEILIYGEGRLFHSLTNQLVKYDNIEIHNKFLTQPEIAELQKHYGIFLCPTRQDAQGVSMCEAMSSGLVPLTSINTAIPEFVNDGTEGLLCNNRNINSFVNSYEQILDNPQLFQKISKNASERMHKQCSLENTILKEIQTANFL